MQKCNKCENTQNLQKIGEIDGKPVYLCDLHHEQMSRGLNKAEGDPNKTILRDIEDKRTELDKRDV